MGAWMRPGVGGPESARGSSSHLSKEESLTHRDAANEVSPPETHPLGFAGLRASLGDHIGHFFEDRDEWLQVARGFLSAGVSRGDRCVYLIQDGPHREQLKSALTADGIDVEDASREGRLVIRDGLDSPEALVTLLRDHQGQESNVPGILRWGGDMVWSRRLRDDRDLLRWEAACNEPGLSRALFLCQYEVASFSGSVVFDALKTHPICVLGRTIHRNPYYERPESLLDESTGQQP